MPMTLRAFAATLAILAAAPAAAADRATIGCIDAGLAAPARAAMVADLERNIAHTDQPQTYSDAATSGLRVSTIACKARYKWTGAEAMAATLYTFYSVGWPIAQREAAARGLVVANLEKDFAGLTEAERTGGVTQEMLLKVATAATKAGHIDVNNSALAGAVLAMMGIRDSSLKNFSGQ